MLCMSAGSMKEAAHLKQCDATSLGTGATRCLASSDRPESMIFDLVTSRDCAGFAGVSVCRYSSARMGRCGRRAMPHAAEELDSPAVVPTLRRTYDDIEFTISCQL